jgi:hypothetical protein
VSEDEGIVDEGPGGILLGADPRLGGIVSKGSGLRETAATVFTS